MENKIIFIGKYVNSHDLRSGTTTHGDDWAAVDIELKEDKEDKPQSLICTLYGVGEYHDKVEKFIDFNSIGDLLEVELKFAVNQGNTGKFYNKVNAWRISNLTRKAKLQQRAQQNTTTTATVEPKKEEVAVKFTYDKDDLPF